MSGNSNLRSREGDKGSLVVSSICQVVSGKVQRIITAAALQTMIMPSWGLA